MGREMFKQLLLLITLLPLAAAQCEEPSYGKYPGWVKRYDSGAVAAGSKVTAEEFNVEFESIYEGYATFKIRRYSDDYTKGFVTAAAPFEKTEIKIELINITGSNAYVSVYTPAKAKLNATIYILPANENLSGAINASYPAVKREEVFEVKVEINNTGELDANNITMLPEFHEFQVLHSGRDSLVLLCPDGSYNFSYLLKAPSIYGMGNYTLIMKMAYSDENLQLGRSVYYARYAQSYVTVAGFGFVGVEKSAHYPWEVYRTVSPARVGESVVISNKIQNSDPYFNLYVSVSDVLPQGLRLIGGSPQWSGVVAANDSVWFEYTVTSDVPFAYTTYSQFTYSLPGVETRSSRSNEVTIKFVDKKPEIKASMEVKKTQVPFSEDRIILDMNESTSVTVRLNNKGSDAAQNLRAKASSSINISGSTSYEGSLLQGYETSFAFAIKAEKAGSFPVTISITYEDAFKNSYSTSVSKIVYVNAPSLTLSQSFSPQPCCVGEVEVNVEAKNVGTKAAYNVLIASEYPGSFKLSQNATQTLTSLSKDASYRFAYKLVPPSVVSATSYEFYVYLTYQDDLGNIFSENKTGGIRVLPTAPSVSIEIKGESSVDLNEYVEVTVESANKGNETAEVKLSALLPKELVLKEGITSSAATLKPSETLSFKFAALAAKSGTHVIQGFAEYGEIKILKNFSVRVKGPQLSISSQPSAAQILPGETLLLDVKIKNIGEKDASRVVLSQPLPQDAGYAAGSERIEMGVLKAGEEIAVRYRIKFAKMGDLVLPAPSVEWQDSLQNFYSAAGNRLEVKVTIAPPLPAPANISTNVTETPTPKPSERNLAAAALALLAYAAIVITLLRKIFK